MKSGAPVGMFDSGVGGLSVLRAVRTQLPDQNVVFLADQAHVPYGSRSRDEIRGFSFAITRFLLEQGARLVVVACNTASAAALAELRREFQGVRFVGMEPAVKPAVELSSTKRVGVLATPATFQGDLYASIVERFAGDVELLQESCPGLVEQIERGELASVRTRAILETALHPMLGSGIDTIVLGCTHYPFVVPLIQEIVGKGVRVIDPSPAVARQTRRALAETGLLAAVGQNPAEIRVFTTGEPESLTSLLPVLLGEARTARRAEWTKEGSLKLVAP